MSLQNLLACSTPLQMVTLSSSLPTKDFMFLRFFLSFASSVSKASNSSSMAALIFEFVTSETGFESWEELELDLERGKADTGGWSEPNKALLTPWDFPVLSLLALDVVCFSSGLVAKAGTGGLFSL